VEFLKGIGGFILTPLYFLVSAVMLGWHGVWGALFGSASGISWALSIIGLTVTIRALMIPLFVKQIKSSRNMQLLQPRVKELQKKYGHDRERLAQETMALYRETKTNPFASCLPLIIQMPFFLALFRMIDQAAKNGQGRGLLGDTQARELRDAKVFGVKISSSFTSADGDHRVQIFAAVLVVAMTLTTFLTQRQLMSKNMPADALTGPYAQQQKLLLYVLPLVFAVGGIAFPIGVLLYWTTSNMWTMGQQFYVIRNNPAPNTEAARAKELRDAEKRKRKGEPALDPASGAVVTEVVAEPDKPAPRQQPKKQTRSQRKKGSGRPPSTNPSANPGANPGGSPPGAQPDDGTS
jgi:YidC/Oxa1 family membrane protein insertase